MNDGSHNLGTRIAQHSRLLSHLRKEHGSRAALSWKLSPLACVDEDAMQGLWDEEEAFVDAVPKLEHLPWDDCVLDFQGARGLIARRVLSDLAGTTMEVKGTIPADEGHCLDSRVRPARVRSERAGSRTMAARLP